MSRRGPDAPCESGVVEDHSALSPGKIPTFEWPGENAEEMIVFLSPLEILHPRERWAALKRNRADFEA